MKTDEEMFTMLAVGEINCPAESGCIKAKRDVGTHNSIEDMATCLSRYSWRYLCDMKDAAAITGSVPADVQELHEEYIKNWTEPTKQEVREPEAFILRLVREKRLYALDTQRELHGFLIKNMWSLLREFYRRAAL